jgi:hypothetical protein
VISQKDVSVAGLAYSAEFLRVAPMNIGAAAHRAPANPHAGQTAHAAVWAVAAITPQRKRRTATATDASVNRGSI